MCQRSPLFTAVRLATLAALLAACASTPTPAPAPASLTLFGATATVPLLSQLIDRFQTLHPSTTVILETGNSFVSVQQVRAGDATLGTVSAIPPDTLWSAPFAVDGIAVVVHQDNPLENLTLAQVREIYAGPLWHWSDLGIEILDDEITVLTREEGSGTRAVFDALAMARRDPTGASCPPALAVGPEDHDAPEGEGCKKTLVTSMALLLPASSAMAESIAERPGAIGYVSQGVLSTTEVRLPALKAIHIEGSAPTLDRIADGTYHLVQPFFFISAREPEGIARQFVDLCLSAEGQALIAQGYVPLQKGAQE
jgi:phosphate transport system substrate-binding protein